MLTEYFIKNLKYKTINKRNLKNCNNANQFNFTKTFARAQRDR